MNGSPPPRVRISVVIPVLDDADELRHCLAALAAQHVPPHEIVVVDNGSTDDTVSVALAAGARVVPEPARGIPRAAAAGYDAATGDVVARLDADSRPDPRWTTEIEQALADPNVAAVTGFGWFHDLPALSRVPATVLYLGTYYLSGHAAMAQTPLWGSSMAMRRTVWDEVRSRVHRDADVHDDMDLAFLLGPTPDHPGHRVLFRRRLRADVSSRSLRGAAQLRRRFERALTTLRLNWALAAPGHRWLARLASGHPRQSDG